MKSQRQFPGKQPVKDRLQTCLNAALKLVLVLIPVSISELSVLFCLSMVTPVFLSSANFTAASRYPGRSCCSQLPNWRYKLSASSIQQISISTWLACRCYSIITHFGPAWNWFAEWDELQAEQELGADASRSTLPSVSSRHSLAKSVESAGSMGISRMRTSSDDRLIFTSWHGRPVMVFICDSHRLSVDSALIKVMVMNLPVPPGTVPYRWILGGCFLGNFLQYTCRSLCIVFAYLCSVFPCDPCLWSSLIK